MTDEFAELRVLIKMADFRDDFEVDYYSYTRGQELGVNQKRDMSPHRYMLAYFKQAHLAGYGYMAMETYLTFLELREEVERLVSLKMMGDDPTYEIID